MPHVDLSAPALAAVYDGHHGAYAVEVFGPPPGPTAPTALALAGPPVVRCGEVERSFGGGLPAWSVDLPFVDPDGALDALLPDGFDPADFAVRVTGPDGLGGTFTVWARPMAGEVQGSASPLVTPSADAALGAHDGLAALADEVAEPSRRVPLADLAVRTLLAVPGRVADGDASWWRVLVAWPFYGEGGDVLLPNGAVDPSRVLFDGELAGDGERGDYGTVLDQLRALAEAGTLTVYQPASGAPDAPVWEVAPRSRVGTALPCAAVAVVGDDVDVSADTFPDRTVPLPPWTADEGRDGARRVRRAGSVRLAGRGPVVYSTPYAELLTTQELAVPVATFAATPGLRFRVSIDHASQNEQTPDPVGAVRLELAGTDGTTYYGPTWTTSPASMDARAGEATSADLPVGGAVRAVLVGETDITGAPTAFQPGAVALEDDAGDPVEDFVVTVGAGVGQAVDVALPPPVLEAPAGGGAAVEPGRFETALGTGPHGTLADAVAAVRLSQQGADLPALLVEVDGLHGPERRFTLAGRDSGNDASPFGPDVELVVVGCEPDLERGTTLLSLVSAAESP